MRKFAQLLPGGLLLFSLMTLLQLILPGQNKLYGQPGNVTTTGNSKIIKLSEALKDFKPRFGIDILFEDNMINGYTVSSDWVNSKESAEYNLEFLLKPFALHFKKVKEKSYIIIADKKANKNKLPKTAIKENNNSLPGNKLAETNTQNAKNSLSIQTDQSPGGLSSQGKVVITGLVENENGEALSNVSVLEKGTRNGTISNEQGRFVIVLNSIKPVVSISSINYIDTAIEVGKQADLKIVLKEASKVLDDVVVVGYGGVKKNDLTGAVVSVKSKELTAYPVASLIQALQGRAAGVLVQANNGEPGGSYKIRVRGGTSVNASSDPIFVVDGFAGAILPPPEDIESMEILKDASSTSIYGSRGANGVILVTTKKGKSGKAGIEINSSYSSQEEIRRLPLLNKDQFIDFIKEINPAYIPGNASTDWQDLIFKKGNIHNTQLSFSGGSGAVRYYLSGSLFSQQGVITNSTYKRFSVTSNVDFAANNWLKIGMNLFVRSAKTAGVRTQENTGGVTSTGVVAGAFKFGPDQPVYRPDGSYSLAVVGDPYDNPYAVANDLQLESVGGLYQFNFYADAQVIKNVQFKTTFGSFSNNLRSGEFTPTTLNAGRNVGGDAIVNNEIRNSYINENFLTYTNTLSKKNKLTVLAGFSYQKFISEDFGARSQSFLSNSVSFRNLSGGAVSLPASSALSASQLASYYGRANYNYSDKYLLTVNARYDGSSNFSRNNKWAFFPSAAIAWNMRNEAFMEHAKAINHFKWRLSYGLTGNQAISPYQTLARFSPVLSFLNGLPVNAIRPTTIANNNLKWETTTQQNIGVDISLFDNRLSFTADYYKSVTADLLFDVPLPQYSGYSTQIKNIGKIENRGVELTVGTKNLTGALQWKTDFNISFNRNKVLELPNGNDIIYANAPGHMVGIANSAQILRVGQPIGSFFGWVYEGVYQQGATFLPGAGFELASGGERFQDISGKKDGSGKPLFQPDGVLNNDDRTIIGNPNPNFIWGLNNDFNFKNIDLNIFFQGSQGNDMLSYSLLELENLSGINNATTEALKRWTPSNTNTNLPAAFAGRPQRVSSRWIFDGSYVRLKNIALGYNLSANTLKKMKLQRLRIYFSAQNIITITRYRGYDPEVNYRNSNLNAGVDYASYPNAKSFTAGISLGF